jgi:hypothetical protein
MTHKCPLLLISVISVLVILLYGCSPIITATPDPSIAWADDFEDGDIEDWVEPTPGRYFFVHEGVLRAVLTTNIYRSGTLGFYRTGILGHESKVSEGTWSFDLFFSDDKDANYFLVLSCDEDYKFGFGVSTMSMDNTSVSIRALSHGIWSPGEVANLGRRLTGWHHFDVTRDALGNSRLYLNRELVVEHKDDLSISPHWFILDVKETGPAFDNLVVRNRVIDFQPIEME